MATELQKHVASITHAIFQIRDMFADPSAVQFHEVHEEMERLEAALNAKAFIDASFAYMAERDGAGRLVGAKYPNAYFKERMGLSPRECYDRLARGRDLFAEPELPPEPEDAPAPEDLFGGEHPETEEERRAREAEEAAARRRREEERAKEQEKARAEQEKARGHANTISAAKQEAIRQELDKLLDAAKGARPRLLAEALGAAEHRDLKDLRATVRRWVDEENRKHRQPQNPNAGMEKRGVDIGPAGADGLIDIHVKATRGDAALMKALLDKGLAPNSNIPKGIDDYRSPRQRMYDQLITVLKSYDDTLKSDTRGAASLVISVTPEDIANGDGTTLFSTNTGIDVTAFDIVRLGTDGATEFLLTFRSDSQEPLNYYRSERMASIGQRIALLAMQGVCSWAGCSAPITECEAHHILAWIQGGNTDIGNLTALCRQHHRCNNDARDNAFNTSYMEYDPGTARAGLRRPNGDLVFNDSDGARHSAGARLRRRGTEPGTASAPPPGPEPPSGEPAATLPRPFPFGPDGPPF